MSVIQDRNSNEWRRVKSICETRISELQINLENDLDIDETSIIRGQIKFAREIIALDKEEINIEVTDTSYIE